MVQIIKTLLIAEESEIIIKRIIYYVETFSLNIIVKNNIDETLFWIKTNQTDLILVNCDLIQNLEIFIKDIRYEADLTNTKIIIYNLRDSSYEKCRRALKSGADDYIYLKNFFELKYLLKPFVEDVDSKKDILVEKAKKLISDNKTNIRVNEIAGQLGLTRFQLLDAFKKSEKMSVLDYIIERRIKILKKYIQKGLSLEDACEEMGLSIRSMEKFLHQSSHPEIIQLTHVLDT